MVALWNRADHYIFILWFLLSSFFLLLFSSPNLSRRRLDVCQTSTHAVAWEAAAVPTTAVPTTAIPTTVVPTTVIPTTGQ